MWFHLKSFLFHNTNTRQTIAKNTFWLFAGQILSRLVRVALIVYAAQVLGAGGWGSFSYALSIATFFTIFTDFGINAVITREAVHDLASQKKYFSTALVIKTALIAAVLIGVLSLSPLVIRRPEIVALMPLVMLVVMFDSLRDFGSTLSRAWEKMEVEAVIQIFTSVIIVAVGFVALFLVPTAHSLALGYAVGTGVGLVAAFYPFRHYFRNFWHGYSVKLVRPILISSWPLGILGLASVIMLNTDTIMIGWFKSIEEVGYYAAVQRIAQFIFTVPALITSAVFPSMVKLIREKERFRAVLENSLAALALLAVPLTLGGLILSREIVLLLYGLQYAGGITAFRLMNLAYVPVFLSAVLGVTLFAYNQERKLFMYAVLGITGNFLFNLLFIPVWGIAGAALSTVLNQLIILSYLVYKLKQHVTFSILPHLYKILAASLLMAGAAWGLAAWRFSVYAIVTVGILLYFSLLFIFREKILLKTRKIFAR